LLRATATFCIGMPACMVDENASHDLRRDRKEVRPIGPADVSLIDETDVGFVDECGRLKCVTFSLATHVAPREPVQFFVNQRIQLVECSLVSAAPLSEQLSDLMLRFFCQLGESLKSCFKLGNFPRFSKHFVYFSDVQFFLCNHAARIVFQQH